MGKEIYHGKESREKLLKGVNELADAVKEMMASKESYFLEVCVEKEDNVFPMIPSGASVSDVRLS